MNVRIFWVRAMKCMYAQTRPRFILSSEGVFGGMEFEPMLTPREKSPLPKKSPEEDRTRDAVDSEPKHYQLSYSGPHVHQWLALVLHMMISSPNIALSAGLHGMMLRKWTRINVYIHPTNKIHPTKNNVLLLSRIPKTPQNFRTHKFIISSAFFS